MVDAATGELASASSAYDRAAGDLEGLQVRCARLGVLEAQVAVARARVSQAEADLEATVIRSPDDGQVLERLVELGGSAKVGQPILSLWIGRGWIEAWTDERDLRKFEVGSPVDIVLWRARGAKFAGRVDAIGLESDKQLQLAPVPVYLHSLLPSPSAMVPVRIGFASNDVQLELGLSATIGIQKGRATGASEPNPVAAHPSAYKRTAEGLAQEKKEAAINSSERH
jgi:multidrug resistance efflux pump